MNYYAESLAVHPEARGRGLGTLLETNRLNLFKDISEQEILYGSCRSESDGIGSIVIKEKIGYSCVGFQPNREYLRGKRESLTIEMFVPQNNIRTYRNIPEVLQLSEAVLSGFCLERHFTKHAENIPVSKDKIKSRKKERRGNTYYAQISGVSGFDFTDVLAKVREFREADYLQVDVPMTSPDTVEGLLENGFTPVSYMPNFAVVEGRREDLVEMVRLKKGFPLLEPKIPGRAGRISNLVLEQLRGTD